MEKMIIAQIIKVRELQRSYFKTRDAKVLKESKEAERVLDNMLIAYSDDTKLPEVMNVNHPTLF